MRQESPKSEADPPATGRRGRRLLGKSGGVLVRYVASEALLRALLILAVVTALMVLAKGLNYLEEMAQGEIPAQAIAALLGLAVPKILALAIPLALFFGLLTTVTRLCLDSEMDAMAAAGVGLYQLLPLVGGLAALGVVIEGGLTLWAEPAGEARIARTTAAVEQQALTAMLREETFNELPGKRVLFFDAKEGEGRFRDVFFQDGDQEPPVTVTARSGELVRGQEGALEVAFRDGVRYQGTVQADAARRAMRFERYRVHKSLQEATGGGGGAEAIPTTRLWAQGFSGRADARRMRTELFRRLAMPLSVPILLMLALPLGVEPRRGGGRSLGVIWGGLLVLAYHNALIAVEDWAAQGAVAPHWLLWAVPAPGLALAVWLLDRRVKGQPLMPAMPRRRRSAA